MFFFVRKKNSVKISSSKYSSFVRLTTRLTMRAGYNKFDYWTSGNRLGTDMLIWMSTGLPFNTTFNQMKRPSGPENNGLDEDLKMNARPELPIARKKRYVLSPININASRAPPPATCRLPIFESFLYAVA